MKKFPSAHSDQFETRVGTRTTDRVDGRLTVPVRSIYFAEKKFFTESVENPVEKIDENGSAPKQSEEISKLPYRGAVHARVNAVDKKPTDYTVNVT